MEKKIMENNEILKKVLLQMNYDSKKTLSENYENINLLTEDDVLRTGKIVKSPGYSNTYEPLKLNKPFTFQDKTYIVDGNKIVIFGKHKETGLDVDLKYSCGDKDFKLVFNPPERKKPYSYTNDIRLAQDSEISIPTLKTDVDKKYCGVVVGGGNKGVDNMAGEKYWGVLLQKLKDAGYPFKEGLTSGTNLPIYWFGPFVIYRYGNTFITYKKGADYHNAKISVLSYKGKYAGQVLTDITLVTNVFSKGAKPNLKDWIDYLYKTTEKTKEIPGTGSKKQNEVPPGGLEKNPSGLKKSKGEFIDCTGTYTYGCKSPKIGEAQKCMKDQGLYSYKIDNSFGLKTYEAIKKKLNKTSFTDADVNVICGKKQDEKSPLDFEGGGGGSGAKEEDYVWRGEFI
jgi:hypothetical protein